MLSQTSLERMKIHGFLPQDRVEVLSMACRTTTHLSDCSSTSIIVSRNAEFPAVTGTYLPCYFTFLVFPHGVPLPGLSQSP